MSYIFRFGAKLFPDVFAPSALRGLPPSWSGIINRTLRPPKIVVHPDYGTYKVTNVSRDEEKRIAEFNFWKMVNQYPLGSYNEIGVTQE